MLQTGELRSTPLLSPLRCTPRLSPVTSTPLLSPIHSTPNSFPPPQHTSFSPLCSTPLYLCPELNSTPLFTVHLSIPTTYLCTSCQQLKSAFPPPINSLQPTTTACVYPLPHFTSVPQSTALISNPPTFTSSPTATSKQPVNSCLFLQIHPHCGSQLSSPPLMPLCTTTRPFPSPFPSSSPSKAFTHPFLIACGAAGNGLLSAQAFFQHSVVPASFPPCLTLPRLALHVRRV